MTAADESCVFIVDDDDGVRSGLRVLLASCGLRSRSFESAQAFLGSVGPGEPGCVLLDVRMPGMSGLELHERLQTQGYCIPVILLTGHGDVPMAVRAMRRGAFDFVQKPFNDQYLLDRIHEALKENRERRDKQALNESVRKRLTQLTAREREVMDALVAGHANKLIALDLGISERTVELHRARVMDKMQARSLADLVRDVLAVGTN